MTVKGKRRAMAHLNAVKPTNTESWWVGLPTQDEFYKQVHTRFPDEEIDAWENQGRRIAAR